MSRASFTVVVDGVFGDEGLIDARELAPSLLGASHLITSAHAALNQGRAEAHLFVRAGFEKGSFEVNLEVIQGWWSKVRELLTGEDLKSAETLLKILGLKEGLGAGVVGLLRLLKWLRGRTPEKIVASERPGTVNIHIENQIIAVPAEAVPLMNDFAVRKAIETFSSPLNSRTVDAIRIKDGETVIETLVEEDAEALAAPEELRDQPPAEVILENSREAVLEVEKVWFRPGHKWVLTDGEARYSVEMKDEEFLAKVHAGEVQFAKGDLLRVALDTTASRIRGALQTAYAVTRVHEVIPRQRPEQGTLFEEPPPTNL